MTVKKQSRGYICARQKRKRRASWEDVVSVCAWCGKRIPEGSEVFSLGAKTRPGVDLESKGNVIELALDEKKKGVGDHTHSRLGGQESGVGCAVCAMQRGMRLVAERRPSEIDRLY